MTGLPFCGTLNLIILLDHVNSLVHVVVLYNFNSLKCVFVCVYMPTDNHTNSVNEELHDTLDEIDTFISSLNVDVILFGGDFKGLIQ